MTATYCAFHQPGDDCTRGVCRAGNKLAAQLRGEVVVRDPDIPPPPPTDEPPAVDELPDPRIPPGQHSRQAVIQLLNAWARVEVNRNLPALPLDADEAAIWLVLLGIVDQLPHFHRHSGSVMDNLGFAGVLRCAERARDARSDQMRAWWWYQAWLTLHVERLTYTTRTPW